MSAENELDRFPDRLRDLTQSLAKKPFWSLLRDSKAAHAGESARNQAVMRAAADEVARLIEPSRASS